MKNEKTYTVAELSKLAGVSVRALHHYDDIGLLKAKRNPLNDYRFYTLSDTVFLQQVTLYKQLGFSLKEIKKMLSTSSSLMDTLVQQHALMLQRQEETQSIIQNLEIAMSTLRGESNLDKLFQSIPTDKADKWKGEIKRSNAAESVFTAYSKYTKEEMEKQVAESDEWCENYVTVLSKPVEDLAVQVLIGDLYVITLKALFEVNPELTNKFSGSNGYRELAETSKNNGIYNDMYRHYDERFPEHLYAAIIHFCDSELRDNGDYWDSRVKKN